MSQIAYQIYIKLRLRLNGVKVDRSARIDSDIIGAGTRIWAFVNISNNVLIGKDCNICDHCFLESGSRVGNRVTIKTGVSVWDGISIEDDVFIGPGVVFCNDMYPRSKHYKVPEITVLQRGCSIGAGSVILPSLTIGAGAMVGAGSVVTKSVPPNTLVVGNPARIIRLIGPAGC